MTLSEQIKEIRNKVRTRRLTIDLFRFELERLIGLLVNDKHFMMNASKLFEFSRSEVYQRYNINSIAEMSTLAEDLAVEITNNVTKYWRRWPKIQECAEALRNENALKMLSNECGVGEFAVRDVCWKLLFIITVNALASSEIRFVEPIDLDLHVGSTFVVLWDWRTDKVELYVNSVPSWSHILTLMSERLREYWHRRHKIRAQA